MPIIVPIKDLRNTTEISEKAHSTQQPIFVTKNGYSDLVVMSSELYDSLMFTQQVDKAIEEAEQSLKDGAPCIDIDDAFAALDKKYYG
ncbi:MAG: type II toxin-antitoxin system Phd/YefM family antitoxin [Erysipelotrichaceae bacterium]|nr:type II toxin-antitoxin system Phd/YefM family antitoxin [Erysipelotrichaceae bacterium]